MSKVSLFQKIAKLKPTIERWHAGHSEDIASLINSDGLHPNHGSVFTSVPGMQHTFFNTFGRDALIKMDIPKEWYKQHKILNPHYDFDTDVVVKGKGYKENRDDRCFFDVNRGGRTSVFDESIPTKFIREVCFGDNAEKCYDLDFLLQNTEKSNSDFYPFRWSEDFDPAK